MPPRFSATDVKVLGECRDEVRFRLPLGFVMTLVVSTRLTDLISSNKFSVGSG